MATAASHSSQTAAGVSSGEGDVHPLPLGKAALPAVGLLGSLLAILLAANWAVLCHATQAQVLVGTPTLALLTLGKCKHIASAQHPNITLRIASLENYLGESHEKEGDRRRFPQMLILPPLQKIVILTSVARDFKENCAMKKEWASNKWVKHISWYNMSQGLLFSHNYPWCWNKNSKPQFWPMSWQSGKGT